MNNGKENVKSSTIVKYIYITCLCLQPGKTNILKQSKSQEGKKDNDKNVQRTGDNKTDSKDDFQQTKIGVTNVDEKNAETSSLYSSDSQSNLSLDQLR